MRTWIKRPGFMVALVVVLASVALIAAACGGDDEADAPAAADTPLPAAPAAPPPGAAAPPPPPPPPGAAPPPPPPAAVAAPVAAPRATATSVPKALSGTIPGSKMIVALSGIGRATFEATEGPYDFSRPGSNPTKDELLLVSSNSELLPHVITDWDFGAETRFWTLTMRDDVYFFGFDRFADSEDLMWSIFEGHWTGFKTGGATSRSFQTSLPSIVDPLTIKIEFEQPTFGIPVKAFTLFEETAHISPSKEILEMGNGDATAGWAAYFSMLPGPPNSAGYKYVSQIPGSQNEYEANDTWFHDPPVDFERMLMIEIPEAGTRMAMMATEAADFIQMSIPLLAQAEQIPTMKVLVNPNSIRIMWWFLNLWEEGHPAYYPENPFLDIRVREAFNIGFDRDEIIDVIYGGLAKRQDAPLMSPANLAYTHPIVQAMINDPIPFDPVRAKQLMQDANFDFDREIKMAMSTWTAPSIPEWLEVNEAFMQGLVKNLGIKATLTRTGDDVVGDQHQGIGHEYELWGSDRHGAGGPDILGPTGGIGPGGANWNPAIWPEISVLREAAFATSDLNEFIRFNAELSKVMRDDWTMIPTFQNPILYGASKEKIGSWPLVPGSVRAHYFEYARAEESYRKSFQ